MKLAINHRTHTHSQIPQGNDFFSAASKVNCSSRHVQDRAKGLEEAFPKREHLVIRAKRDSPVCPAPSGKHGSTEASEAALAQHRQNTRSNGSRSKPSGAANSTQPAGWTAWELPCSGNSLALVPGEFTSGQQLCMPSPASWQWATHYLLLRRGVREEPGGHLLLTKVNPTPSVQEHPSHLLPQGLTETG